MPVLGSLPNPAAGFLLWPPTPVGTPWKCAGAADTDRTNHGGAGERADEGNARA